MISIPDAIIDHIIRHGLSNTAGRVLFFLLSHHEPVSTQDISRAVGVSGKATNKALKRLREAGLLEPGELETRKRMYRIPGAAIPDGGHEPEHGRDGSLDDRLDSMEAAIMALTATIEAMKAPQAIPSVPIDAVKVEVKPKLAEPLIIAKQQAMLLNTSKQAASDADMFRQLFGVDVPVIHDPLAVAEMIRRKKAGKLADLKSPLAYLGSISGKLGTGPSFPVEPVPVQVSATKEQDDIAIRNAINQLWAKMTDEELEPYRQKAREKYQTDGHKKVPIELLTRQIFNNEQLAAYR